MIYRQYYTLDKEDIYTAIYDFLIKKGINADNILVMDIPEGVTQVTMKPMEKKSEP